MAENMFDHAVIIGAGVGGLAAAGALAGHSAGSPCSSATTWTATPDIDRVRRNPARCTGCCRRGLEALGQMFPGFGRDLAAAGAVPCVSRATPRGAARVRSVPSPDFGHPRLWHVPGVARAGASPTRARAATNVESSATPAASWSWSSPPTAPDHCRAHRGSRGLAGVPEADLFVDVSAHARSPSRPSSHGPGSGPRRRASASTSATRR